VYQHARQAQSYGGEDEAYPGDSRGLTSVPSGEVNDNFRNAAPTMHNKSMGGGVKLMDEQASTPGGANDIAARNIRS
jgi:hypothetical protein